MELQKPLRSLLRLLLRVAPLAMIALVLYCCAVAIAQSSRPLTEPSTATQTGDTLRNQIVELERRTSWLQWNLTLILTAAGLFTIAQGAFAFFNAQSFIKQADDAVQRIEDLSGDVTARYPMFTKAEEARKNAFRTLTMTFGSDNAFWLENLYSKMPLRDRQLLLSVENFVGLEFLDTGKGEPGYVAILRGMGNFYAYKYHHEGQYNMADFDRAVYYLDLACDRSDRAYYVLNDLGLLHSEILKPRNPERGQTYFEESLRRNPRQQRALYNLANIAHGQKRYVEAVRLLEQALGEHIWEQEDARISVESSDPTFIRFYAALFRPAIPFPER